MGHPKALTLAGVLNATSFSVQFTGLSLNENYGLFIFDGLNYLDVETSDTIQLIPTSMFSIHEYATGTAQIESFTPQNGYENSLGSFCMSNVRVLPSLLLNYHSQTDNVQTNQITSVSLQSNKLVISGKWNGQSALHQINEFEHGGFVYQLSNGIDINFHPLSSTQLTIPLKLKRYLSSAYEKLNVDASDLTVRTADPSEMESLFDGFVNDYIFYKVTIDSNVAPEWVELVSDTQSKERNIETLMTYPYYQALFYNVYRDPLMTATIKNGIMTMAYTVIGGSYFTCPKGSLRNEYQYFYQSDTYHYIAYSSIHPMFMFEYSNMNWKMNTQVDVSVRGGDLISNLTNFENTFSKSSPNNLFSVTLFDNVVQDYETFFTGNVLIGKPEYRHQVNSIDDFSLLHVDDLGNSILGPLITQEGFTDDLNFNPGICDEPVGSRLGNQLSYYFSSADYTMERLPEYQKRLSYSGGVSYLNSGSIDLKFSNHEFLHDFSAEIDQSVLKYQEASVEWFNFTLVPQIIESEGKNATIQIDSYNSGTSKGDFNVELTCSSPVLIDNAFSQQFNNIQKGQNFSALFHISTDFDSCKTVSLISQCTIRISVFRQPLWSNQGKELITIEDIKVDYGYFIPLCQTSVNEPFIWIESMSLEKNFFSLNEGRLLNNILVFLKSNSSISTLYPTISASLVPNSDNPFVSSIDYSMVIQHEYFMLNFSVYSSDISRVLTERFEKTHYTFSVNISLLESHTCWSTNGKGGNFPFSFQVLYDCPLEYTGIQCDIPICYGINATESNVCSSHGECTSPDTCHCHANYTSRNCSVPICYGVSGNNESVCSSKGDCLDANICLCKFGHVGSNCEIPICHNVSSNESNVCSGHGVCVSVNNCSCDEGFYGKDCEFSTSTSYNNMTLDSNNTILNGTMNSTSNENSTNLVSNGTLSVESSGNSTLTLNETLQSNETLVGNLTNNGTLFDNSSNNDHYNSSENASIKNNITISTVNSTLNETVESLNSNSTNNLTSLGRENSTHSDNNTTFNSTLNQTNDSNITNETNLSNQNLTDNSTIIHPTSPVSNETFNSSTPMNQTIYNSQVNTTKCQDNTTETTLNQTQPPIHFNSSLNITDNLGENSTISNSSILISNSSQVSNMSSNSTAMEKIPMQTEHNNVSSKNSSNTTSNGSLPIGNSSISACVRGFGSSNCSGNGNCIENSCKCNDGYTGTFCQFKTKSQFCSGSFVKAHQITVKLQSIVLERLMVDTVCGKSILINSEIIFENVSHLNLSEISIVKYYSVYSNLDGTQYISFDSRLNKNKTRDALELWRIDGKDSSLSKLIIPINYGESSIELEESSFGLVKFIEDGYGNLLAITKRDGKSQVLVLKVDFKSKEANLTSLFEREISFSNIANGNLIEVANKTIFTMFLNENSLRNETRLISLDLESPEKQPKDISIPVSENNYGIFSMILSNPYTGEQFLLLSGSMGTLIRSIQPNLVSENAVLTNVASDSDFTVSKSDTVIVREYNSKILVINTDTSISLLISTTKLTLQSNDLFSDSCEKMIIENPFMLTAPDNQTLSNTKIISLTSISTQFVPISSSIQIQVEGEFSLPNTTPFLVFKHELTDTLVENVPIQTSSGDSSTFIMSRDIRKSLPEPLVNLETFQVSVWLVLMDDLGASTVNIATGMKITMYRYEMSSISPRSCFTGSQLVIRSTFYPPKSSVSVKLLPQNSNSEITMECKVINTTNCVLTVPNIDSFDTIVSVKTSVTNLGLETQYDASSTFRYVDSSIVDIKDLNNFDTSIILEDIPNLDRSAIPIISKIPNKETIEGQTLTLQMNTSTISKAIQSCGSEMIRQVVSSSDSFNISNSISLDLKISNFNVENGNLFEVWMSKKDVATFYAYLSIENTVQYLSIGQLNNSNVEQKRHSVTCAFDSDRLYYLTVRVRENSVYWELKDVEYNIIECSAQYPSDNRKLLQNAKGYQIGIGQSFGCTQLVSDSTQVPILALSGMKEVCISCKVAYFIADVQEQSFSILIGTVVGGFGGFVLLFVIGLFILMCYLRKKRLAKFKYVYYGHDSLDRSQTIQDLFKASNRSSSEDLIVIEEANYYFDV